MRLPYVKIYFQQLQWRVFLFMDQINQILLFSLMNVLERSKITVQQRHIFKKIFSHGNFRYVSSLSKKVFSAAPVNHFFLYGPNNSKPNKTKQDSLVFRNASFRENKDHSLRTTPFQKILINKSFGFVSTLRKKVFSGALVKFFPFYGPSNSDSVVFGNATFAEIKDHSLKTTSKKIDMKVLSFFLPYVKWHCQGHQWRDFLFMAQMIQILLFLGVPFLERSKITVWEWHLLKKRIYYRSFEFLPALCKKVFLKAQVKCFSLYGSHNSDSAVFGNVAVGEIKDHTLTTTPFQKKLLWMF